MENTEQVTNEGLKTLLKRIDELLNESRDAEFTAYLNRLKARAGEDIPHIDDYSNELSKNYEVYCARFKQIFPWEEKREANRTEFTLASVLLGLFGGIFILTSLILFCVNFMTDFMMGMFLYVLCAAVFLSSELLLYKKIPKLAIALSAIAVGGFYVVNGVNCFKWHNINIVEAVLLCGAVSLVNVIFAAVRKKNCHTAVIILNMLCNLIFTLIIYANEMLNFGRTEYGRSVYRDYGIDLALLVAGAIGIFVFLFVAEVFFTKRINAAEKSYYIATGWGIFFLTAFIISSAAYYFMLGSAYNEKGAPGALLRAFGESAGGVGFVIITAVLGIILFFIMHFLKLPQKWWIYYITLLFANVFYEDSTLTGNIMLAVMLVLSRALCYANPALRFSDTVLVLFAFLAALFEEDITYRLIVLAAMLMGIVLIKYYRTLNEILFLAALVFVTYTELPTIIKLPSAVGVLFVGMFVFNTFDRYRDRFIAVLNTLVFIAMFICFAQLFNPVYRNAYITYIGMLVFGLASLIIMLTDRYNMQTRFKSIIIAVFATYMALIFKSSYPMLNSIFLMIIALICVVFGFVYKETHLRIYGISLSLLTCVKLIVYDFAGVGVLQRTILFFVVGIIALIIAGIYIILERRYFKDNGAGERLENADGH